MSMQDEWRNWSRQIMECSATVKTNYSTDTDMDELQKRGGETGGKARH